MILPITLCTAGAATVIASWLAYFAAVPSGDVPARPVAHIVAQAVGMLIAIGGVARAEPGLGLYVALVPAAVAWVMGGLFLFLLSQRRTPLGELRVSVGDPLPSFAARTGDGGLFDSSQLLGKRTLFKVFRGHW